MFVDKYKIPGPRGSCDRCGAAIGEDGFAKARPRDVIGRTSRLRASLPLSCSVYGNTPRALGVSASAFGSSLRIYQRARETNAVLTFGAAPLNNLNMISFKNMIIRYDI